MEMKRSKGVTFPHPHHENSDLQAGGGAGSGHMAAKIPLSRGSVFRPPKSDSCQARLSAVRWWGAGGSNGPRATLGACLALPSSCSPPVSPGLHPL